MITRQFIVSYIDNLYHSWIFNSHYLLEFQRVAKEKFERGDFIGKDELQAIAMLEQIVTAHLRLLTDRIKATQFAERINHQYRIVVKNPENDYFADYDIWDCMPEDTEFN